jgi:hypothetical protein
MARPIKHNADYFSHDVHMRNDIKIKSIRRKFGHEGYSIWIMVLELLTNSDYFEYEWSSENILLLEADFDCDADRLEEIIKHCVTLNLLQIENNYLTCNKLMDRLESEVLVRRTGYCRENAKRFQFKEVNVNNNFTKTQIEEVNVNNNEVNVNKNGQSKGKESKVNKIKVNESKGEESEVNKIKVNESKGEESEVKETEVNEIRLADKLNDIKNRIHSGEFISFQLFQAELLEFNLSGSDEVNLWNSI